MPTEALKINLKCVFKLSSLIVKVSCSGHENVLGHALYLNKQISILENSPHLHNFFCLFGGTEKKLDFCP